MARDTIRAMKRTLAAGLSDGAASDDQLKARESALALLERSIGFGHRRLAVIRLATAVNAGAEPSAAQWLYCRTAAEQSRDMALQQLWLTTAAQAAPSAASIH